MNPLPRSAPVKVFVIHGDKANPVTVGPKMDFSEFKSEIEKKSMNGKEKFLLVKFFEFKGGISSWKMKLILKRKVLTHENFQEQVFEGAAITLEILEKRMNTS